MHEERVTVAHGDGVGPEIMEATLGVLETAGARLRFDRVDIGEAAYRSGHLSGIGPEAWETIRRHRAFLKAPITTPQGGGYKSLNVTIRKALNLFANVRPTKSYAPYVASAHPGMNVVIVRENEEDLYGGIEHQQTREVTQVLKLVSRPGSERVIRYAFEYARAYGRKKVTCMTKDNIMKVTDGLFSRVFREIAAEYPDLEADHQIIDIGAARLAAQPEQLDVVVTLNLYGDILSDVAAQIAGSVGLAGSANVGDRVSMFEAVHGSAPDIAGKDVANPSGLLLAATQMLIHLGRHEVAETIKNAWLRTIEDGVHTADLHRTPSSRHRVGTQAFGRAVIDRLGDRPRHLLPVRYRGASVTVPPSRPAAAAKALVGVDVFLDWSDGTRAPERLASLVRSACPASWELRLITNRGVKVFPDGLAETFCTDHWRCRLTPRAPHGAPAPRDVVQLLSALVERGLDVIKTENLYTFDGRPGYSLGQGE